MELLLDLVISTVSQFNTKLIAQMLIGKRDFFHFPRRFQTAVTRNREDRENQHRTNTTSMPEPGFEPETPRTAVEHLPAAPRRPA